MNDPAEVMVAVRSRHVLVQHRVNGIGLACNGLLAPPTQGSALALTAIARLRKRPLLPVPLDLPCQDAGYRLPKDSAMYKLYGCAFPTWGLFEAKVQLIEKMLAAEAILPNH